MNRRVRKEYLARVKVRVISEGKSKSCYIHVPHSRLVRLTKVQPVLAHYCEYVVVQASSVYLICLLLELARALMHRKQVGGGGAGGLSPLIILLHYTITSKFFRNSL